MARNQRLQLFLVGCGVSSASSFGAQLFGIKMSLREFDCKTKTIVMVPETGCDFSDLLSRQPIDELQGLLCTIPEAEMMKLRSLYIRRISFLEASIPVRSYRVLPTIKGLQELSITPESDGRVALRSIGQCTELRQLSLPYSDVTNESVQFLASLCQLIALDVSNSQISKLPVSMVALQRLEQLQLARSLVGDDSVPAFAQFPNLKTLSLSGTNISDEGVAQISRIQTLRELFLSETRLSDATVCEITKMQNLRVLSLDSTDISRDSLTRLCEMKGLQLLFLSKSTFTPENRRQLEAALGECTILWK